MNNQPLPPNTQDLQQLVEFLTAPERPDSTFTLDELRGFLYAVACAPEPIISSDWLTAIFEGADVEFSDSGETGQIAGIVMALYDQINEQILGGDFQLAWEVRQPLLDNLEADAPLHQWSQGFLAGHEWLAELWNEYMPAELADEVDGMLVGPIFFSSRAAAEALFKESERESFEELADKVLGLMQEAMPAYARIGRGLGALAAELKDEINEPIRSEKIGRNDVCLCGSGKKYKKCCGRH